MSKTVIIEKQLRIPPDYQYKALNSRNFVHSNWYKNKLEAIEFILNLEKSDTLLDLGIGSGNLEILFSDKCGKITGIDYNKEAVVFARKTLKTKGIKNVNVLEGNILKLNKLKNLGSFNYIVIVDVIEHFKLDQAVEIVRNLKQLVKKNGSICIVTPNFKSSWVIIEWLLDKFKLVPELAGKQHLSRFDKKSLSEVVINSGFKIEKLITFNKFSYLIPLQGIRKRLNKWEIKHSRNGAMLAIVAKR